MSTVTNNDIAKAIYLTLKSEGVQEGAQYDKVVEFLARKRLLSRAHDILSRLARIINTTEGRTIVKVSSAEPLTEKTREHLTQALGKYYPKKKIVLEEEVETGLVGGLRLEVNDEVIDLSVRNKLNKLQTYLTQPAQ
jgi:F-type H+-transporting ATPase subunit delta